MACGFLAQTRKRTVCGMLTGAGLSRLWPRDRAHSFFSRARWNPNDLGLTVAKLMVSLLVPNGEPVTVAIDDTLFRRRGKKVWAAGWFHDGSAADPAQTGYGNNWVIAAIVVRLPFLNRPVAVPALAKLVIKDTTSASRLWLARRMAQMIAQALPGRKIHVTGDAAYAIGELKKLPPGVTWTTRLRKDAALYGLSPARTGRRGRPRVKGDKLPARASRETSSARWANFRDRRIRPVTVTRYDKTATVQAAIITCLWHSVFGSRRVQVVLIRDTFARGYDQALVTPTRPHPRLRSSGDAHRDFAIEVAIEDAKQVFGAGQARNRKARAVERTIPFQLACHAIATCWYATIGHNPADIGDHRFGAPVTRRRPSHPRRHGRQAPPRHHHRQISPVSPQ
jgi:DDE superfamily endonuclease